MVANPTYEVIPAPSVRYTSFEAFYPFYLGEHRHPINRIMHLFGTSCGLLLGWAPLIAVSLTYICNFLGFAHLAARSSGVIRPEDAWKFHVMGLVMGYGVAFVGHFFVEKNRPATFKYPLWSFFGDVRMLYEVVTLQRNVLVGEDELPPSPVDKS